MDAGAALCAPSGPGGAYTPGWDLAATTEAVGREVKDLAPGQRVFGPARFPHAGSTYAEHGIVPAKDLVPTPELLTDAAAAALPMAAMTAVQAFTDTTTLRPGQRVLITGAGGGVGHLAVQLAHHLGATVIALASKPKHQWLHELGADVTVDYTNPSAVTALKAEPVDLALSLVAVSHQTALAAVRPGGTLIALGAGAPALAPAAEAAGVQFAATHVRTERGWLETVATLAAERALTPTVTSVFDLHDATAAHQAIETGHSKGKIVLRI